MAPIAGGEGMMNEVQLTCQKIERYEDTIVAQMITPGNFLFSIN